VPLLKDNQRIEVPVDDAAIEAAIVNVEWSVDRIIDGDFPMRPHPSKCEACDSRIFLTHMTDRELRVVAFGEGWQKGVVEGGAMEGFEGPVAAGLSGAEEAVVFGSPSRMPLG